MTISNGPTDLFSPVVLPDFEDTPNNVAGGAYLTYSPTADSYSLVASAIYTLNKVLRAIQARDVGRLSDFIMSAANDADDPIRLSLASPGSCKAYRVVDSGAGASSRRYAVTFVRLAGTKNAVLRVIVDRYDVRVPSTMEQSKLLVSFQDATKTYTFGNFVSEDKFVNVAPAALLSNILMLPQDYSLLPPVIAGAVSHLQENPLDIASWSVLYDQLSEYPPEKPLSVLIDGLYNGLGLGRTFDFNVIQARVCLETARKINGFLNGDDT